MLLAPRKPPRPPAEKVAPILQAEVERREPARAFLGVQEMARTAISYTVALRPARAIRELLARPDFGFAVATPSFEDASALVVSHEGELLTHVAA